MAFTREVKPVNRVEVQPRVSISAAFDNGAWAVSLIMREAVINNMIVNKCFDGHAKLHDALIAAGRWLESEMTGRVNVPNSERNDADQMLRIVVHPEPGACEWVASTFRIDRYGQHHHGRGDCIAAALNNLAVQIADRPPSDLIWSYVDPYVELPEVGATYALYKDDVIYDDSNASIKTLVTVNKIEEQSGGQWRVHYRVIAVSLPDDGSLTVTGLANMDLKTWNARTNRMGTAKWCQIQRDIILKALKDNAFREAK